MLMDLDTNLGSSKEVYFRIENINLNRTIGKVGVAVTYWINQDYSENFKHSLDRVPKGQISDLVVFYEDENSMGEEINLPTFFEFYLTKPLTVKIPIYEIKEIPEEVPYVSFDQLGRKITKYRTIQRKEKIQIGEKTDITQVLDPDIENSLVSWCYGQVKAKLADYVPVELLIDVK